MFKLQKSIKRPSKSKDRMDFKFSDFKILQVPTGWEKLSVSLISVKTGKSFAKLDKEVVKNGGCQWRESLLHSICISRNDDDDDDDFKCYELKLVASSGSTKHKTLGEATVNLEEYFGSGIASDISLPLKNGAVLELKVECLTPRSKLSPEESKCLNTEELSIDLSSESIESNSNVSDSANGIVISVLKSNAEEETQSQSVLLHGFDPFNGSMRKEELEERLGSEAASFDGDTSNVMIQTEASNESPSESESERLVRHENLNEALLLQIKELKDSDTKLRAEIRLLEEALRGRGDGECESTELQHIREIESLKQKVQELENDCDELTNENLELIFKINDLTKTQSRECTSLDSSPSHDSEVIDPNEEEIKRKKNEATPESSEFFTLILQQVNTAFKLLGKPKITRSYDEIELGACFFHFLQEINEILESKNAEFYEISRRISDIQTTLDKAMLELQEHERLTGTRQKNLDHRGVFAVSKGVVIQNGEDMSFRDKIMGLELQIIAFMQVSKDVHEENQLLKEEIKCSATNIQRLNSESMIESRDLNEKCSALTAKLYESREFLSDYATKLKSLDDHLTKVVEYFYQKEHVLESGIREIIRESSQWIEKLALVETTLKTEDLEKELELLKFKLSDAHKEKERISFEACNEVSLLLADKAELEAAFDESETRFKINERKLNEKLQESEFKVEELMIQVTASIQSIERLMLDHETTVKLLTSYKKNEEKMKSEIDELNSKLKGVNQITGKPLPNSAKNDIHTGSGMQKKNDSSLGGVISRHKNERTRSSLETELKDLREMYLEMSLKYAEVEVQREDLVMKLKERRGSSKRWF